MYLEKEHVSFLLNSFIDDYDVSLSTISKQLDVSLSLVKKWKKHGAVPGNDNLDKLERIFKGKKHMCLWCDEVFTPTDLNQDFCSKKCEEEYKDWRENRNKVCNNCGKTFQGEGIYCSRECRLSEVDTRTCIVCGEEFIPEGGERICSRSCRLENTRNRTDYRKETNNQTTVEKKCAYCGENFQGKRQTKYCSDKCRSLSQVNPNRYSVFYRDNFRCRYCGRTPADGIKLTLDHVYPKSEGGKEKKINLVTACSDCNIRKSDIVFDEKLIKEIWYQNKLLANNTPKKNYEEIMKDFQNQYSDDYDL